MTLYLIGCLLTFAGFWAVRYSSKKSKEEFEVSLNDIGACIICTALSWAAIIVGGFILASIYFEDHGDDPIITIKKKKSE